MRPLRLALAALALTLPLAGPLRAEGSSPYELVRALQDIQEDVARGNASAQTAQAAVMRRIGERLAESGPELWQDPRNLRAVISYLLSGGSAGAVKTMPDPATLAKPDDILLRGALAYAAGRDAQASRMLQEVDPKSLPASLGGHVALVRALLLATEEPAQAIPLLDLARLLSPGTLVEEAALRLEASLVGQAGDIDRFLVLSRQYLVRYRRSLYASNFLDGFGATLLKAGVPGDSARQAALEEVVAELPPEERRGFYLQIARATLISGKSAGARFAADRAARLASVGTADGARASLYQAAGLILTDDFRDGEERLKSLREASLGARDAELRDSVSALAKTLRNWAPPAGEGAPTPTMTRAQDLLASTEPLLVTRP